MPFIPAALQSTYANLLQAHLTRAQFEFEGAPFKLERSGKSYWYANQRIAGGAPRQRYLGPDTGEMRERIAVMRDQTQSAAEFRRYASSLVAQLRAGGLRGLDRRTGPILRALVNSGVFRLGGTLVGTVAFNHYEMELGALYPDDSESFTQTEDIDIASFQRLSMAIEDTADPLLAEALAGLGFRPAASLNPKTPTSWTLADSSYAIDFLTPSFEAAQKPVRLAALNIWAQGLHFLNFLIKDPMPAVSLYMEGLLIQVPRPERYAVHKLIVSQVRAAGSGAKRRKDMQQASLLIFWLSEADPHALCAVLAEAREKGLQWRTALDRAMDISFDPDTLRFNDDRSIADGNQSTVRMSGTALGRQLLFRITAETLVKHFGAPGISPSDLLEAASQHRSELESLLKRKFRLEPSPAPLLTAEDAESLR